MSLRCSLLGHTYGEAEIEREREEQGSEVVVTVREFEECGRCGKRSVLSENKEVTALGAPDLESAEAEVIDGTADEGSAAGANAASDAAAPSVENDFEQPQSAEEDDGVILEDDDDDETGRGDEGDRQPGEWPEAETTHPAEAERESAPTEWPDVGQEDEGFDAEPAGGESADVEFGGGLTPESAPEVDENEAEEVEFVNAEGDTLTAPESGGSGESSGRADLSAGFTSSGSVPAPDGPAEDHNVDAEFVCPACDHREGVGGSSLRAGDICPECRKGYIARE